MAEIGDNICAVLKADSKNVYVIGYGTYLGEEIPDKDITGQIATMLRNAKATNPKLEMEDGTIVWGCECWWGDVESAIEMMGGRKVIQVDMEKERQANV